MNNQVPPQKICVQKNGGKVRITLSNYYKNLIFNLQLQNRITVTTQLLKSDKFGPLGGFEGGFQFYGN